MLQIRTDQIQRLESPDFLGFETRYLVHVRQTFGGRARLLSDDELREAYGILRQRAERHGFRSGRDVGLFIDYALMIGAGFDRDPLLPWARLILEDRVPRRARRLFDGVTEHLDRFVRGHMVFPILPVGRLRRTPCVAFDDHAPTAFGEHDARVLCRELWPTRANALDEPAWRAFSAAVAEEAQPLGLATPAGLALLTALCFVLGIEVARDPMLPMLAKVFDRERCRGRPDLMRIRGVVRETIDKVIPSASGRRGHR